MIKTFDKNGKITKAALKARYPKYIVYIDCSSTSGIDVFKKAMIETDLLEAMRTVETAVNKKADEVYMCGIYQKTDKVNEYNEPLYEMVIGTRMGEEKLDNWKFWDKDHGESAHGFAKWYSNDCGKDEIEEWSRDGVLEWTD